MGSLTGNTSGNPTGEGRESKKGDRGLPETVVGRRGGLDAEKGETGVVFLSGLNPPPEKSSVEPDSVSVSLLQWVVSTIDKVPLSTTETGKVPEPQKTLSGEVPAGTSGRYLQGHQPFPLESHYLIGVLGRL